MEKRPQWALCSQGIESRNFYDAVKNICDARNMQWPVSNLEAVAKFSHLKKKKGKATTCYMIYSKKGLKEEKTRRAESSLLSLCFSSKQTTHSWAEITALKQLFKQASSSPIIALHMCHRLSQRAFCSLYFEKFLCSPCHICMLKHKHEHTAPNSLKNTITGSQTLYRAGIVLTDLSQKHGCSILVASFLHSGVNLDPKSGLLLFSHLLNAVFS